MKVKEIKRTANIAWSPSAQYPVYLATGTAAQQLDATFSTSAALEIFALDLTSNDLEMPRRGTLESEHRFHKLVWSPFGIGSTETKSGLLVGGTDKGSVVIYNADKILKKDKGGCIFSENEKHTGAVQALDFNPFQPNLLASGASDSEIFIWDMNNPGEYFTPGAKSLPPDNISCLAWNRQVQHILASSSPCGRCVVWDLRKNEPIIKVGDQSAMIRCKAVEWHPDTATQMVLASEDDRYPVIQMWDLRFATSPMKVLEGHQRGILSIAWCPQDPDLLMSCAKDNRILCWNPNEQTPGNEIVYELPTTSQWSFDVRWCPRNPAMICTSSFDGNVSLFSLMGGGTTEQMVEQQKVNDAFDADDPFGSQLQQQQQQQQKVTTAAPLKKPPKWLRRPCGAKFAFGGKLITFGQHKDTTPNQVHISQVVTEGELVRRSVELEGALVSANFIDYCNDKIQNSTHELERTLWSFLKINFEREPRKHFLTLLGYDTSELSQKVASITGMQGLGDSTGGVDAEELAQKMQLLTSGYNSGKTSDRVYSSGATTPSVPEFGESKTPLSDTGSSSEAALAFDAIASGAPLTVDTSGDIAAVPQALPFKIPTDDDTDGLISQALLTGNFEAAVDVCVHKERMADAFLLAIAGGPDLLARIQKRYFEKSKSNVARLMSVVINRDWRDVVENCVLENWKEALAALVTYAKPEEFTSLCDLLGQRLEGEGDRHFSNAMICYICAGNVEKFVACWSRSMPVEPSPLALQDLVEKVMVLKKAVERERRQIIDSGSNALAEKLSKYSTILAAQGCLETAMGYLNASGDQSSLAVLKDRVFHSQNPSHLTTSSAPPAFPFQRMNVLAEPAPQQQTMQQQQQQPKYGMQQTRPQQPPGPTFQPAAVSQPSPYQPTQPQHQAPTPFYNPAAYQPAPTQPPSVPNQPNTGLNAGTPPTSQSPYYTPNIHPPLQGAQQPWSAHQPQQFQPPPSNVPMQPPVSQTAKVAPPSQPLPTQGTTSMPQMYNPASQGMPGSYPGVLTPGAPQGNVPSPTGPPPVGPPPSSGAWSNTHLMPKRKQQTSDYTPPAPITMPIFGVPDQQQQQPMQQQHQQYQQQQPYQQQQQAPPSSHLQPAPDGPNMMQQSGPPGAPPSYPSPRPAVAQEKPAEIIKGPLPAEHVVIQETFNGLVQRCKDMANNPHTKRKLDEVSKRLEGLYDRLREQKLSKPILTGLHEIAQACQSGDYPRGLMAHTGLISSGSFSEISSFMPGLKSLMQIATQLRV
ncbi:protein transport protein Sec31A-like [Actinia tenebrosa]|uniref:Protein transport protein Sec31A n=1 Tax=Actinia tenebrosa TaxID=6105 RepID=A0A6P8HC51_ACTTE|nr:protein transport protein Sec31A-like [Actinia tenebrosa]XP_031552703.1 protein transport protein Sec31A-like [Actinia tenebrosa]